MTKPFQFTGRPFIALWVSVAVFLSPSSLRAQAPAPWLWRNPLPTGNTITAATYGNGIFVAADDLGNVFTSPDLVHWNSQTVNVMNGIVYALGRFVGAGAGIYTSTDGMNWTAPFTPGDDGLLGIEYSTNGFAAVGYGGAIVTSPDGTNWTGVSSGTTENLYGVAYGTNGYVAVGDNDTVVTSPDGVSWTPTTLPTNVLGAGNNLAGVAFGNGLYVAVGENGIVLTSPDGTKWTDRTNPAFDDGISLNTICYGRNEFVTGGGQEVMEANATTFSYLQTSTDGIHWTTLTAANPYEVIDITYTTNGYLSTGAQGAIETSPDGITWTSRSYGTNDLLFGATFGANKFVIVGGDLNPNNGNQILDYTVWSSVDGVHWTRISTRSGSWLNTVTYGNNQFVAAGINGVIATSPDGVRWTSRSSGTSDNFAAICCGSNLYVTVGQGGDVHTSPNGVNWTSRNSQTQNGLTAVAYGNNEFVAVGYGGTLVTSPDGTNWTSQTPLATQQFGVMAFGNGVFVAIGVGSRAFVSSDGTNWTNKQIPGGTTIWAITFGNGVFEGVGIQGFVVTSPDGLNWGPASYNTTDIDLYAVAAGNDGFVAATQYGGILQSADSVVPPTFGPLQFQAGLPLLTLSSVTNQTYMIQSSTDLINWTTFTNVTLTNTSVQALDLSPPSAPWRFYRAVGN